MLNQRTVYVALGTMATCTCKWSACAATYAIKHNVQSLPNSLFCWHLLHLSFTRAYLLVVYAIDLKIISSSNK